MRILVVEDDPISRQVLVRLLEKLGDCAAVDDGFKAVELFEQALNEQRPFDLICMDIMLPGLSGHAATQRIRSIEIGHGIGPEAEAKIIMTTALDDVGNVVTALDTSGANAYVVKPIRRSQFMQELEKLGLI
ncbi:MAG: Transcriptional activator protein CzcR [Deltaproteobacteria bacterium ADurb.Bin510]|nr:MAG: Transcriptional activator protein CzcR [Deltaproteobacteria bacterium ADurb.Bin510]